MRRRLTIIAVISPLIFALDQFTKELIVRNIPLGGKVTIWPNLFDLVYFQNRGAAFGILSGWDSSFRDIFFYCISVLALFFLFYYLKKLPPGDRVSPIPVALIFGGALGNVFDRIFRGSVVDFLSFHWNNKVIDWRIFGLSVHFDLVWPAFNAADSAITVGVFWLLILMAIHQRREHRQMSKFKVQSSKK
ncbi:MAG: signal peptidase II [Deltaproteobacteria bacterium]|nr:signal peptidase II [Deltaproteobacteria bacterium]